MVKVVACQNEQHEADYVVNQITRDKLIGGDKIQYADFAILYRSNHQARVFEEALRSARIPYQMSGGQSFFEKAEIKDILAYMRLLTNFDDDPAFIRAITTPKRGVGEVSLGKLNEYAHQHECSLFQAATNATALLTLGSKNREAIQNFVSIIYDYQQRAYHEMAGEIMENLLSDIGYENYIMTMEEGRSGEIKWRNVLDLVEWLARKSLEEGKNLIELTQTIALMTLLEGRDEKKVDAIKMSTLHAAKGLEYKNVFLVGCEEGLFPHADSVDEGNLEEERRLMYVGITRAKYNLILTHCLKRKRCGNWHFPEPSRFIEEMPSEDIQILGRKGGQQIVGKEERKKNIRSMHILLDNKKSILKENNR